MRNRTEMTTANQVQSVQRDMDRVRRQAERMRNEAIGRAVRNMGTSARQLMGNLRFPRSIVRRVAGHSKR